ncbi:MAG: DUF2735 domain-containing protein [Rhizobiaceae bacterium]
MIAAEHNQQTGTIIAFPAKSMLRPPRRIAMGGDLVALPDRNPRQVVDYDAWYHAEAVREDRGQAS